MKCGETVKCFKWRPVSEGLASLIQQSCTINVNTAQAIIIISLKKSLNVSYPFREFMHAFKMVTLVNIFIAVW